MWKQQRTSSGRIKAVVVSFDDVEEAGSEAAVMAAGRMRLVGKDYIMPDGDVAEFRFNMENASRSVRGWESAARILCGDLPQTAMMRSDASTSPMSSGSDVTTACPCSRADRATWTSTTS